MIPWATPSVLVALMWKWILDPNNGVLNQWLLGTGIIDAPIEFLSQNSTALPTLIMIDVWQGIPLFAIMILAALQSVSGELKESAQIDGCGPVSVFRHVVLPAILPTILIALALLQTFDRPQPLIGGQVLTGTTWLLLVAYIIVKVPFTLRRLKAAFAGVPQSLEDAARILGARSLTTFRRVLVPLVIPTVAAITALNFNSLLDDYDAAVFLYQPLYEPLGIAIKASTEGEANLDSMSITFVYTVLLMIIMGVTMYLVYGRGSRAGAPRKTKTARKNAAAAPADAAPKAHA
jgi:ABC-type sugar transport system permease subunit